MFQYLLSFLHRNSTFRRSFRFYYGKNRSSYICWQILHRDIKPANILLFEQVRRLVGPLGPRVFWGVAELEDFWSCFAFCMRDADRVL